MTDLATRIETVYCALEGELSPRGARAWFAREARISPRHVSRLVSGQSPIDGPVLSVLEQMEARARLLV